MSFPMDARSAHISSQMSPLPLPPPSPSISAGSEPDMSHSGFLRSGGSLKDDKGFMRSDSFEMDSSATPEGKGKQDELKHGPTDLRRALSERHVNMIAFSSTVGIGCFLQSGKVIQAIGPGGAVIAYLLMGTVVWSALASLGEMASLFPVRGPIIDFPSRYIDEGVGFATGWMAWIAFCVLIATEISAVAELFQFGFTREYLEAFNYPQETLQWTFGLNTNPDVWVAIVLVIIFLLNLLPIRAYGEVEYVFGCVKMVFMVGIILFNVIISSKNVHDGRSSGTFATYDSPYGFLSKNVTVVAGTGEHAHKYTYTGGTGHLVGMWSSLTTIFFSLQGFYTVSITAAENKDIDRDESIKLATRKISLRVILLYSLLVFTVGLNVPYTDPNLLDHSIASLKNGQNSPFIIAMVHSGVTGWPHVVNAFFIFSAFSVAVNALYISSRILHALANIRNVWPETGWGYAIKSRLEKTTHHGVPVPAICVSWLFGLLGFLGGSPAPAKILGRMATYTNTSMMIVYIMVCVSFLSFKSRTVDGSPNDGVIVHTNGGGTALNRNASDYPYKSHLQWARALYGLVGLSLILFFNGWKSFLPPFSVPDFFASYTNFFVFVLLVSAYHIKDQQGWNPLNWSRRVTMDINNPMVTREKDPLRRKGRLHRANKETFFCRENAERVLEFIWTWMK